MKSKMGIAKRQIGEIITSQSAAFQQSAPPLNGVAINISSNASYLRQAPLKIF